MSKRPSFQFYPADWRGDPGLRLCSIGARGLWIDMLCLMHEGEPYGHLRLQGKALGAADLSRLLGESRTKIATFLKELRENSVCDVDPYGVIFSRRMVRDEVKRQASAEIGKANGIKGKDYGYLGAEHGKKGGRPKAETPADNPVNNPGTEPAEEPPQNPRFSSSSSSPSSEKSSDTIVSGAEAPIDDAPSEQFPDPDKVMFDAGLRLLKPQLTDPMARRCLGKWRRDYGSEAVIVALGKAQREGAIDPVSFIEGCLRNGQRNGPADLRGSRPDPALDLWRQADAAERAEMGEEADPAPDSEAGGGTGSSLPPRIVGRS